GLGLVAHLGDLAAGIVIQRNQAPGQARLDVGQRAIDGGDVLGGQLEGKQVLRHDVFLVIDAPGPMPGAWVLRRVRVAFPVPWAAGAGVIVAETAPADDRAITGLQIPNPDTRTRTNGTPVDAPGAARG